MAQWIKVLTALLEDLSSIPGLHVVAHNCNCRPRESEALFWLLQGQHTCDAQTQADTHPHTHE